MVESEGESLGLNRSRRDMGGGFAAAIYRGLVSRTRPERAAVVLASQRALLQLEALLPTEYMPIALQGYKSGDI